MIESCTIIKTEANEVLEPVHDRMPVILDSVNYDLWLAPDMTETDELQKLLVPFPASKMSSHKDVFKIVALISDVITILDKTYSYANPFFLKLFY